MSTTPALVKNTAPVGSMMAFGAMACVQLGLAASLKLADDMGPTGVAWLRLAWAAIILVVIARPWRLRFSRSILGICVLLGLATAGMTLGFMLAIERIPMGTASALEFLGPLSIAVIQGRGAGRWWALVAAAGVLGLTEPWHGATDMTGVLFALGSAVCWAVYVVLTQRAGDAVDGIGALAISMPVAAVAATFVVGPSVVAELDLRLILFGFGIALLLPVIPFSLEMLALRKLSASAFGTLMCLEPAIALVVGLVFMHQVPRPLAVVGIVLVILAGIGATRTGERTRPAADQRSADAEEPLASGISS
ncbi:DMT family transporter [Paeniglutamicibacter sp. Y32M11]|uniref:EamA family transporter n=1 Tax=Paeniglutamicibacter sp. Y32M11 TaxID=2853258 RepID=UPI002105C493|nr:EamA family transporter [Paeniglutamicibacter sp. Y32M11]